MRLVFFVAMAGGQYGVWFLEMEWIVYTEGVNDRAVQGHACGDVGLELLVLADTPHVCRAAGAGGDFFEDACLLWWISLKQENARGEMYLPHRGGTAAVELEGLGLSFVLRQRKKCPADRRAAGSDVTAYLQPPRI